MPPVTGSAFSVSNGNDEHVIGFDGVERGVRKDPRPADMHVLFNHAPAVWPATIFAMVLRITGKAPSGYFNGSIFPLTVTKNAKPRSARSATSISSGKHFVNLLA